jgi:hypothetical protein
VQANPTEKQVQFARSTTLGWMGCVIHGHAFFLLLTSPLVTTRAHTTSITNILGREKRKREKGQLSNDINISPTEL